MTFRLPHTVLDSAIYLYTDEASARVGQGTGASGFLLGHSIDGLEDRCSMWAVTNRHVIEDGGWVIRLNRTDGSIATIQTTEREWLLAKDDDLAVRPISLSEHVHQFSCVPDDLLLTEQDLTAYDIGPGDPCFMVGRFVNHDGIQRNTPTARFGQIAQLPNELVEIGGFRQLSFLVEIRSIGGYSGSPVFVFLDDGYYRNIAMGTKDRKGRSLMRGRFPTGPWLLGVDWCMLPTWERVCDAEGNELPNKWMVPANSGMMGVVPAWRLRELLDSPAVKKMREAIEEGARTRGVTSTTIKTDDSEKG